MSEPQRVVLLRMVPFVERNYNLVELGSTRGTGKSHLFQQISPYSRPDFGAARRSFAKMFVNNASGATRGSCVNMTWSASTRSPESPPSTGRTV